MDAAEKVLFICIYFIF